MCCQTRTRLKLVYKQKKEGDDVWGWPYILKPEELVATVFTNRARILEHLLQRRRFWGGLLLLVLQGGIVGSIGSGLEIRKVS